MTIAFILKAVAAVLGSTVVAYFIGKFIGRAGAQTLLQEAQGTKDKIGKVQSDAAKGDDKAVLGDLREALDKKGKR